MLPMRCTDLHFCRVCCAPTGVKVGNRCVLHDVVYAVDVNRRTFLANCSRNLLNIYA